MTTTRRAAALFNQTALATAANAAAPGLHVRGKEMITKNAFAPRQPDNVSVGPAVPWQTTFSILFLVASLIVLATPSNYFGWIDFPFIFVATAMAWWGFFRKRKKSLWSAVVLSGVIFTSLFFVRVIYDLLY